MIRVDESDPVGEIEPSFPYRDVTVRRGIDFKSQYDIRTELGRGKFGTVFQCKDKKTGLSLAAKVVNITKKEDRRCVEREVEIMRRLQHPRLIQLYDAIDNGKHFYVILELIEGGELFERVIDDDFVLTERSCAVFMRQICEGMEFVHSQFILHLDMKPENILCLTKEGNRIKIIDFGLARHYDPSKKLQVLFGTPEFVAPEVVNFDQIGFGTDMWSIGVICYVLLSGLSPFMGDNDLETMANVTIAKYDFDHEAFANISEDAKDFIRTLLVKDIEKRATASQCREHRWLARKNVGSSKVIPVIANNNPQNNINNITINNNRHHLQEPKHELDMTKDNLRLFVERWREHPDSPYTIDPKYEIDSSHLLVSENDVRSVSLRGQSPSPCGSICSSSSESFNDTSVFRTPKLNLVDRRASDSATSDKHRDPATQIILADEIIKLSEHLRTVALNSFVPNEDHSKKKASTSVKKKASVPKATNEIAEKLSTITRQRKLNGTTFNGTRKYESKNPENSHIFSLKKKTVREPSSDRANDSIAAVKEVPKKTETVKKEKEMDLIPPWRKPRMKHKFSELGRDVPRITNLQDLHKNLSLDEPTSTKNLLLQLLNEWDDVSRPTGVGRKSISFDWCAEDVARRSMNSLAEYFHLEQQKAATAAGAPSSASSVRR